jgi:hypothetical protein
LSLDQVKATVASLTADGAYDQEGISAVVAERHPETAIIVPPRSSAVLSETGECQKPGGSLLACLELISLADA